MKESEKDKLMMKGRRDRESVCVCVHPIRNRKLTVKTKDYGHYAPGFLSESSR